MNDSHTFIPYTRQTYPEHEVLERSHEYYQWLNQRRTVRQFSEREIDHEVIRNLIRAAGTAPSGAHKQPWTFCVVTNGDLKRRIREAAEAEEYESYHGRMSDTWINDLKPLGTDWQKPFLETAPALIAVFKKTYDVDDTGKKLQNYYVQESVGLACGLLITAIHHCGLVALTHTPSPMNFLSKLLDRPEHEKPFLLIPIGYPAPDTLVPDLQRKSLDEICIWY